VSNVIGDAMLALWVTVQTDTRTRGSACLAALDIVKAVDRFNLSSDALKLPTRIGLHSGHFLLTNLGAIDHFEYRPVGDIVNTATRIEGFNKHLGTRILASEEVVDGLDGFATRKLGEFVFVGKSKPLVIHELISGITDTVGRRSELLDEFAWALDAFRSRAWDESARGLDKLVERHGNDGPSLFYRKLCDEYRVHPPGQGWSGVVRLDKK
jgi:adenylate cyclase